MGARAMKRIWWGALALAATAGPACAQDNTNTIGGGLQTALNDAFGPVLFAIVFLAFAAGLFLFAKGLVRLTHATHDRGELGPAFLSIVAAVLLICLPEVAGVGVTSVFQGSSFIGSSELLQVQQSYDSSGSGSSQPTQSIASRVMGFASVGNVDSCLSGSTGGSGTNSTDNAVTCMAHNIAANAVPMGVLAIFIFAFLAGLFTFASCVIELTKGDQNQRTPSFWMKLLGSILLMNAMWLFVMSTNTILGMGKDVIGASGLNSNSTFLSYSGNLGTSFAAYAQLIGYCFVILAFFGVFAFVRGITMLKNAAEGKGQATYTSGMVFMFAGILLANAKYTSCMVLTTVAGSSASVTGFCS